ncbi:MAG: efflux RND transporter periplasmic adaptor subunit [candidate division WOR-3 bacterium]
MIKKKKKYIFISGAIVLLLVIGIFFRTVKGKKKNPFAERIVQVRKDNIVKKVTESGKVEPVTSVNVKSALAGEVIRLFVEEGDKVKIGQKLALIRPQPEEAQKVAQIKASIKSKKLDLEEAERNLKRKETLYEEGFIAAWDVEDAKKQYENCKIQLELAIRQLWVVLGGNIEVGDVESLEVDNITLTSSINGTVTSINVEEGEMITSGTQAIGGGGTTIMTISDLSEMIVKVNINEVDIGYLAKGQNVRIGFDAIKGVIYKGKVKKISPSGIESQNLVVYPVEVEILNPDGRIRPGMTADLDIIVGEAKSVLCIPKEAILKDNGRTMVLLRRGGKITPKPVVTGLSDEIRIEIKGGLKEGDTLLVPLEKEPFGKEGRPQIGGGRMMPPRL